MFDTPHGFCQIQTEKDAGFFLATGDPPDLRTEVRLLIINGKAIDMSNGREMLYEKSKSVRRNNRRETRRQGSRPALESHGHS